MSLFQNLWSFICNICFKWVYLKKKKRIDKIMRWFVKLGWALCNHKSWYISLSSRLLKHMYISDFEWPNSRTHWDPPPLCEDSRHSSVPATALHQTTWRNLFCLSRCSSQSIWAFFRVIIAKLRVDQIPGYLLPVGIIFSLIQNNHIVIESF